MKRLFRYTLGLVLAGITMTACTPDKFDGADELGIPTVSGQDFTMTVDQETNQVQVSFAETPGVYPIWLFNGASYSTLNKAGWQNNKKGTYFVELRLGNRNGFSQGAIRKEFTFNETKASYATELSRLSKAEWRIDYAEVAHLACGPAGGDGSGWWNAAPGEKRDFGVYDDRISFESDGVSGGTFTYDPGADGKTYINIGCTLWDKGGATADFDMDNQLQTSTFELMKDDWTDGEGNVIETNYMTLGANTFFPYISSDDQYKAPRFRIETLTASKLVMVYEKPDKSIAWRFIFTNKEDNAEVDENDPANVKWVAVDSPENLGRDFNTKGQMNFWWADAGWGQIGDPQFSFADGVYTIKANDATAAEWQAQNSIQNVALNIEAGQTYDISIKLTANQALGRFTFKVCEQSDDDNTLIYRGDLSLDAGENLVQFANVKAQKNGADTGFKEAKLFIDLGGCPAGLEVKLSDIIIQKHVNSSGGGFSWADVNSPDNIGNGFNSVGAMQFWWADSGWGQIGDPGFAFENGVYVITATENGGSEWQAQCSIHHVAMNIETGQQYAVRATIEASAPVSRYTFKICDEGDDDNTLIYNGQLALDAGENIVEFKGVKAQKNGGDTGFKEAKLFIDLGGITPGTVIRLSDIIVQKYDENSGSQGGSTDDTNYGADFNTIGTMQFWWANGSWTQIGDPGFSFENGVYTITATENGGSEWMAQCSIHNANVNIEAGQLYDVTATIEASAAVGRYTFKVCDESDDDNVLVYNGGLSLDAGGNDVELLGVKAQKGGADTGFAIGKLFIDLGGIAPGTVGKLSNITIKKH